LRRIYFSFAVLLYLVCPADHFDIVGGIELSNYVTAEQVAGACTGSGVFGPLVDTILYQSHQCHRGV
jgi:hypothetical protein